MFSSDKLQQIINQDSPLPPLCIKVQRVGINNKFNTAPPLLFLL